MNIRASKLGDATIKKLRGTSLDSAAELDELVMLNRGAPEGEHTPLVKRLVTAAIAGECVSAIDERAKGENPWLRARIAELENENHTLSARVEELENRARLHTSAGAQTSTSAPPVGIVTVRFGETLSRLLWQALGQLKLSQSAEALKSLQGVLTKLQAQHLEFHDLKIVVERQASSRPRARRRGV
jgi:hypothetical protein